jgi:hypothetical protein
MAFDPKPSTWLGAGFSVDTDNHCIKLNTNDAATNKLLTELTDAEAHATSGDIRKVIFALLEMLSTIWLAIDEANRPTRVLLYKSSQSEDALLTHTYTGVVVNNISAQEVADEPA